MTVISNGIRVAVCVKHSLYPSVPFEIDEQSRLAFQRETEPIYALARAERSALKKAEEMKHEIGAEVIAISVGPRRAEQAVRAAIAVGASKGILLLDENRLYADARSTAVALGAALSRLDCSLVLCGASSLDEGSSSVPPMLAEMMGWPQITFAVEIEFFAAERKLRAVRRLEQGRRDIVECNLPAVVSVESALAVPRYVSINALRRSHATEIEILEVTSLLEGRGDVTPLVDIALLSPPRPRTKKTAAPDASKSAADRLKFVMAGGGVKPRADSNLLEGTPDELAAKVLDRLRKEGLI